MSISAISGENGRMADYTVLFTLLLSFIIYATASKIGTCIQTYKRNNRQMKEVTLLELLIKPKKVRSDDSLTLSWT